MHLFSRSTDIRHPDRQPLTFFWHALCFSLEWRKF